MGIAAIWLIEPTKQLFYRFQAGQLTLATMFELPGDIVHGLLLGNCRVRLAERFRMSAGSRANVAAASSYSPEASRSPTHGEIEGDLTTLEDFTVIAKQREAEEG